jgi:O-antigen/teichoic acid export membrane protein
MRWLAPTFLLAGLSVLPRALLERNLRFKALGLVEAAGAALNGGTAIALALSGHGVWSVVAGIWAAAVLQFAAYWATAGVRPGLAFTREELGELLRFGTSVLGSRMLGYFNGNVDYLIVGRLMGSAALGVYSLAYKLVTMPLTKVSHVVLRVAYPTFSRLQGDDEAFQRHYLTLVATLAAVSFPLLAGLAIFAPEIIGLVFGARWDAAVLPTRVLCLVGVCKALVCSIGVVFMSKGRPGLELKLNLYGAVKLPIFLLIGAPWGLPGVAWAYLASSLTGMPVQQHFANRLLGLSWRRYLQALAPAAGATAAMALGLGAWHWLALAPWASLAGALLLGPALYLPILQGLGFDWRGLLGRASGRTPKTAPAAA